jgi:hypothetical protein
LGKEAKIVSDLSYRKRNTTSGILASPIPTLWSVKDYYPYGAPLLDRVKETNLYSFGFNGQRSDTTLGASHTTAQFWEYDAWLGRRWNVDPVFQP